MSNEYDLSRPDRFTVGTEGPVGQRLFLLQCRQGPMLLTVKIEKQQVAVLASYLARIVREVGNTGEMPDDLDLEDAGGPDWAVGTIGVSYDEDSRRVMVVLEELTESPAAALDDEEEETGDEDEEEEEGMVARVALSPEQAAAFAIRATRLVEAGRPPCPLCGFPLDPSGHNCPRANGHRPPAT
jgi:uncharacterized repeat protein (TIGR03847 family)